MMTSADDTRIEVWKKEIYKLELARDREGKRISHAGERKLSDEYTKTDTAVNQAKADFEQQVGRPYTPPETKPSQFDSTLFIKPRSRTASSESQIDEKKVSDAASNFQNHAS